MGQDYYCAWLFRPNLEADRATVRATGRSDTGVIAQSFSVCRVKRLDHARPYEL